jgi:hypothetical protein
MTRRRKAFSIVAVAGLLALVVVVLRVAPVFTGPGLPAGAERLHLTTAAPNLNMGCAAALLSPVRVSADGAELLLVSVETGETVRVVWPAGFGAWRIDGRAIVADPWGSVVGREGDVLDTLGGGEGLDGAFQICPFGILTEN